MRAMVLFLLALFVQVATASEEVSINQLRQWAEQGDANAQLILGDRYVEGKHVPKNTSEALKWYRRSADQGNANAQFALGYMHEKGEGVPQNDSEALKWFRKSADQGDAVAQNAIGDGYGEGKGMPQSDAEALKWYRKSADQGYFWSQISMGDMFQLGRGVRKDNDEAKRWYRVAADNPRANEENKKTANERIENIHRYDAYWQDARHVRALAEKGDWAAQLALASAYELGTKGLPKNNTEAEKWYLKAANQGGAEAQIALAEHFRSLGNKTKAISWYRKAADQRSGDAAEMLWLTYALGGKDVEKNSHEAKKWFDKAVEWGSTTALDFMAKCYEADADVIARLRKALSSPWLCQGIRLDYAEAASWYRKLGEDGILELGDYYLQGKGVTQDDAEAYKSYRAAFDSSNRFEAAAAAARLGFMYALGRGVKQDSAEALRWWDQLKKLLSDDDREDCYANGGFCVKVADAVKLFGQASLASITIPRSAMPKSIVQALDAAPKDQVAPSLILVDGNRRDIVQGELHLSGQASDASGIAEVTVNGQHIAFAQDGAFSYKRFFPLGQTVIEFKATDIHGNTATQKVTVIRQAAATQIATDEPELTPPLAKARQNPNALALIVGVQDYRNAPQARWAAQDAAMFYDFAQRSLGIPAGNIKLLTGEQANRSGMLVALKTWLAPMVSPGKSQVYVYFAGHGLAASEGDKAYLLPQDGDPSLLEDTALDRQRLFDEIAKVKPLSTTVFLDTCYSGGARGGDGTLVANARPVMIKSKAATLPPGFMQFSASSGDQLAHSHPSQQHGLFSYYLMRGLSGEADANRDNKLTAGELQDYVQAKVKRMALTQGRPQEPELIGDRERVIANWGR